MTNSDFHRSAATEHAKVADWMEDQARIATDSLHCGDNSGTIQRTHAWARKLEAAALHLRAPAQAVQVTDAMIEAGARAMAAADGWHRWQAYATMAKHCLIAAQPLSAVAQACAVRLEARPADNSKEWTEIFPAQLEWVAKEGHQVRAIELAAQPLAAPVETDDYTWYDAYNKLSAAYMGLIAERDAGAQCSAATEEPFAWVCELAHGLRNDGQYYDWREWITKVKPRVPDASIRNLLPLYLNEPQGAGK